VLASPEVVAFALSIKISDIDIFLSKKEKFIHILTFVSRIVSSFLLSLHPKEQ
jgi:hypothetical protein